MHVIDLARTMPPAVNSLIKDLRKVSALSDRTVLHTLKRMKQVKWFETREQC